MKGSVPPIRIAVTPKTQLIPENQQTSFPTTIDYVNSSNYVITQFQGFFTIFSNNEVAHISLKKGNLDSSPKPKFFN
jgi:hypothetical protein